MIMTMEINCFMPTVSVYIGPRLQGMAMDILFMLVDKNRLNGDNEDNAVDSR